MTEIRLKVQSTPNPNARKFIVSIDVRKEGKASFDNAADCKHVPLAKELLNLAGVKSIHFFENVISLTKQDDAEWGPVIDLVDACIQEYGPSHEPDFKTMDQIKRQLMSPEMLQIEELLDEKIRPYLQNDGGDVEVVEFKDDVLSIRYQGACGTCPSSMAGTLYAIQGAVREDFNPNVDVVIV